MPDTNPPDAPDAPEAPPARESSHEDLPLLQEQVKALLRRWALPPEEAARLAESGLCVERNPGQAVADVSVNQLSGETGARLPQPREPEHLAAARHFSLYGLPDSQDPSRDLKTILGDPDFASRYAGRSHLTQVASDESAPRPILDTAAFKISEAAPPGDDAGLTQAAPPATRERHVGLATGGNGGYAYLDPYAAGRLALAEAARNLACAGAFPLYTVSALRLGEAMRPETVWQWQEFARAIDDGCRAFNAPAAGERVLFSIPGTPAPIELGATVAMAGLISQTGWVPAPGLKEAGDAILLLGHPLDAGDPLLGLGGSAYLRLVHRVNSGTPPVCDFEQERALNLALRALICSGAVKSAHDCAQGGLALALLESCVAQPVRQGSSERIGAQIDLTPLAATAPAPLTETHSPTPPTARLDAWLFGEAQARIIISVAPLDAAKVLAQAGILGIPAARIGTAGGTTLQVKAPGGELNCELAELGPLWRKANGFA